MMREVKDNGSWKKKGKAFIQEWIDKGLQKKKEKVE